MNKLQYVRRMVERLGDHDLDPLDLLSWEHLLDLWDKYKTYIGGNLDVHHDMQECLYKALWKKAGMYAQYSKNPMYESLLREMQIPEPPELKVARRMLG
jgi:hypothetical protein